MRDVHVRVDRSRMQAYQTCPRLRFLGYHALGLGLRRVGGKEALELGDAAHKVVAGLWGGGDIVALLGDHLSPYLATPKGVALWLALRSWAHYRFPALRAEYDVVLVERELLWELGRQTVQVNPQVEYRREDPDSGLFDGGLAFTCDPLTLVIEDMIRVDALLRSRTDGGLYYFELKTTGTAQQGWAKQWPYNLQVQINTLALEELFGERVDGVLIEGLLKDDRWATGYERINPKSGELERSFAYKAKWEKVSITDPEAWWPTLDEADWASVCLPVAPIRPLPAQLARKRAQLLRQEVAIWEALPHGEDGFPQYDGSCMRFLRYPCEFVDCCYTRAVANDPLGSGLYERRTPHHPLEIT